MSYAYSILKSGTAPDADVDGNLFYSVYIADPLIGAT